MITTVAKNYTKLARIWCSIIHYLYSLFFLDHSLSQKSSLLSLTRWLWVWVVGVHGRSVCVVEGAKLCGFVWWTDGCCEFVVVCGSLTWVCGGWVCVARVV